jgi:hypothetical protein
MSLHAPLALALLAALLAPLAPRAGAVWTPHVNMTAPFVLSDVTRCAPVTQHCLAVARTLAPSRFSQRLQRDEQSVPENYCMHAAMERVAEGARRFGAQPCMASATNASDDVATLFFEAASWGACAMETFMCKRGEEGESKPCQERATRASASTNSLPACRPRPLHARTARRA